jgi:hypothetical protein
MRKPKREPERSIEHWPLDGTTPVHRAAALRRTPPAIAAEPRYVLIYSGHSDLSGFVPAVRCDWPGTRLWIHGDGPLRTMDEREARERSENLLLLVEEWGNWPAIVREAIEAGEMKAGGM